MIPAGNSGDFFDQLSEVTYRFHWTPCSEQARQLLLI